MTLVCHNQSSIRRWTTKLVAISLLATGLGQLTAVQSASAQALNLGNIIQSQPSKPRKPKVYLKLPQRVPVPRSRASVMGAGQSDTQNTQDTQQPPTEAASTPAPAQPETPAPGQIATPAQSQPIQQPQQATAPAAQPQPETKKPTGIAKLNLTAHLTTGGEPLQRGINWRIFEEKKGANGQLPMVLNQTGGPIEATLPAGDYIVYAGYGYANLTKRIQLPKTGAYSETFDLQAGALRLNAMATGDVPLDSNLLTFNIYTRDNTEAGTQELIAKNVKADYVVKLTEGTYHVVSSYGTANAKVRGDVEVKAGKLISVTMIHNAAKVTLRLVSEPGGEALANTVWTVLTPGGDLVKQAIGAFPTLALASGDYTAIAKQGEEIYNRDFSVDAGLDRDIEVLAKLR